MSAESRSSETTSPNNSTSPGNADAPDLSLSRHALLAEAFEHLARDMGPFIDERMVDYFPGEISWTDAAANRMGRPTEHGATDPLFQLLVLRRFWGPVFADFFGEDLRPLIGQLIEARNFWAHFNLPDDSAFIERILLSTERLVAPVAPDSVSAIRRLRTRLKNPVAGDSAPSPIPDADRAHLQEQLDDSERVFGELQGRFSDLTTELEQSRVAAELKQARIAAIEAQLSAVHGRSDVLAAYLEQERHSRHRMEWLFVSFITVMLIVMVIISMSSMG